MNGLHLIADLFGCACATSLLRDCEALRALGTATCAREGLTPLGAHFHQFFDASGVAEGVTGAIILAESHLALHTWPESASVTVDLYVCNFSRDNTASARAVLASLVAAFMPAAPHIRELERGALPR